MLNDEIKHAAILVIDDNVATTDLLAVLLKKAGYTNIHTENDSRNAVNAYQTNQPDLVLLDICMPYVDGFQVIEQIKGCDAHSDTPIIVVTEKTEYGNKLKALQLGAKSFIHKPFNPQEIMMRIQNTLAVHLVHKRTQEQNRTLFHKVQQQTKELQQLQVELLDRLVKAVEFRDADSGDHIWRMSWYCYELAKASGLSKPECLMMFHASKMHDIGKVAVPDYILLKPEKLTTAEREVMKEHAVRGAEILSGSSFELLQLAETIAHTHHEWWDGTGYPQGLCGEVIPLAGRIAAICDVFDALQSDRPYKAAWPIDDIIAEMQNSSGKQFDPALVGTFLRILPRLLAGRPENIDSNIKLETCW